MIKHGSKVCYSCWKIYNREGLTWRQLNPKKPSGGEALLLAVGCEAEAVAFVGDRLLTDVVFGNQNGFLTIHTQPLTEIGDNWMASKVGGCICTRHTQPTPARLILNFTGAVVGKPCAEKPLSARGPAPDPSRG